MSTTKRFDIKKVAIIGGGPGGLSTLNELLHTSKDGTSTITKATVNNPLPENPAFEQITVFEQNDHFGGVWNFTKKTDPPFPEGLKQYFDPAGIRTKLKTPSFNDLLRTDKQHPIVQDISENKDVIRYFWRHSGLYEKLFTNIPNHLMRFSSGYDVEVPNPDPRSKKYAPFVIHSDVEAYLEEFVKEAKLEKYIRYNTVVDRVFKKDGKWQIVLLQINEKNKTIGWYLEQFDAVVVATGRFNIPFFPKIEGLQDFVNSNPGVVIHAKAFRNEQDRGTEKVLLVGTSVSAVDLLQYLIPKYQEVHLSGNVSKVTNVKETKLEKDANWTDQLIANPNLKVRRHPRIKSFEGDKVTFEDGTSEQGFERIIFATGYHIYYPFLDIPENDGKDYVSVSSGLDGVQNYARTKIDNLYLYTFSYGDPTLAHIGIAHNPLFFLACEANAIAIAGVWSNRHKLPPKKEQRKWIDGRFVGKKSGFQVFNEQNIQYFISELYKFSADGRYNFIPLVKGLDISDAKDKLKKLFARFVEGGLEETSTPDPQTTE